jgi:hypothetical protein
MPSPFIKGGPRGFLPIYSLTIIYIGDESFVGGDWLYKIRISKAQSWLSFKNGHLNWNIFVIQCFSDKIVANLTINENILKLTRLFVRQKKRGARHYDLTPLYQLTGEPVIALLCR